MYSLSQVSKLIEKSRQQAWNLVQNGKLEAIVMEGGTRREYRITEDALQEYLDKQENLKSAENKSQTETEQA